MKTKIVILACGVLAISLVLGMACGGDGDGDSVIRTESGLSVAALAAGAVGTDLSAGGEDESSGAPVAPAPDIAIGAERQGLVAPDIAPFPFPSLQQQSQTGITVQGFGSAAVDADSAVLELYFSGLIDDVVPLPEPGFGRSEPGFEGVPEDEPAPPTSIGGSGEITEADLQPIVDAIAAQGVARDDIEVIVEPFFGDVYYGGSATVRATIRNVDRLESIVDSATEAAGAVDVIFLQGTSVSYSVSDCASLEQAAMQAAVDDARERGQSFAGVLGVGLGSVLGASSSSFSPFGGSPCDSSFGGPYPLGGIAYAEGQTPEVELIATVTITFSIQ